MQKLLVILFSWLGMCLVTPLHAAPLRIPMGEGHLRINPDGFRFEFVDAQGQVLMPAHSVSGMLLDGNPIVSTVPLDGSNHRFLISTAQGERAELDIRLGQGRASIHVLFPGTAAHKVSLRMGGGSVAYGLGDAGGWNPQQNLVGEKDKTFPIVHDGHRNRWASSFAIFPMNRVAGVIFAGQQRSVTLGPGVYAMEAESKEVLSFHYLTGSIPDMYRNYLHLRVEKGYPNLEPHFSLFNLGWESWAALGWQTNAETMYGAIRDFQDKGYPIRWAVTGSGFWEQGGTTTSFGKFGEKFPEPQTFRRRLHERKVKWMIGLRTNFVPDSATPHVPTTQRRDHNLVVSTFNGNPRSNVGLERGFFLKNTDGSPLLLTSSVFPIVPALLLDGRIPEAAAWFAQLYQLWGVDGIKEDTMMRLGDHTEIFNQPIARISESGGLVMARCGSFSSPGTLQRVEDTNGVKSMSNRTPLNYLQYAASGAPNVYSDTMGFRTMKSYSDAVIRHGWLLATTAGMSVGETPFHWTETEQALFKKPVDFHYRLGPYLFDAAIKSWQTGYPHTMTPLGIAFPDDADAMATPHFQWMIGESILAVPLLRNPEQNLLDIYLPAGLWFDYDTGERFEGPRLLRDVDMPPRKTPCFVGGKGIVVERVGDEAPLRARIFPVSRHGTDTFTFHHPDGKNPSTLTLSGNGTVTRVQEVASGRAVDFQWERNAAIAVFDLLPGVSYRIVFEAE